jgi:acyl-CoA reductase-like NAD-dependent aldehyde dehydrogenase
LDPISKVTGKHEVSEAIRMSKTLTVHSPYDRRVLEEIPLQSTDELERQLAAAREAFEDRRRWMPSHERVEILERIARLMNDNHEELVRIAAEEGGKPYTDSLVEVKRAIQGVHVAIHTMHEQSGREIPMGLTPASVNRLAFTHPEPIGVIASISAFNHPINLVVHQTIPAIAVGAPVIIKPALKTPRTCLRMMQLYRDAGLDEVWCRAFLCEDDVAGKFAADARVGYLSFIGSAAVGWMLRSKLAPGARAALEHGGLAPVLVEADADIDGMAPGLAKGGFYHAGQVCVSVQRVFAHVSVAEKVAEALRAQAEQMQVGDPIDSRTDVGPLITPENVDRVGEWVKEATDAGARVLCGGEALSETCYKPTVLLDPPADAKVSRQEIFGPVVCVYPVADREEAIRRANDTPFHFQASVFTRDLDAALDMAQRLDATAVMINDHTAFRVDWMPFGGRDHSGLGLGGIPYSMQEMTRTKMLVIKSPVL